MFVFNSFFSLLNLATICFLNQYICLLHLKLFSFPQTEHYQKLTHIQEYKCTWDIGKVLLVLLCYEKEITCNIGDPLFSNLKTLVYAMCTFWLKTFKHLLYFMKVINSRDNAHTYVHRVSQKHWPMLLFL